MQAHFPSIVDEEIRKFQGTWIQTKCEADGITNPPDEFGSEPRVTFTSNTYVVTRADGTVVIKGTYTIDPSQEPKAIDWTDTCGTDAEKTFPAIYYFEGDQLIFCAADEGLDRPKVFQTRVGDTLRIHRRITA